MLFGSDPCISVAALRADALLNLRGLSFAGFLRVGRCCSRSTFAPSLFGPVAPCPSNPQLCGFVSGLHRACNTEKKDPYYKMIVGNVVQQNTGDGKWPFLFLFPGKSVIGEGNEFCVV